MPPFDFSEVSVDFTGPDAFHLPGAFVELPANGRPVLLSSNCPEFRATESSLGLAGLVGEVIVEMRQVREVVQSGRRGSAPGRISRAFLA